MTPQFIICFAPDLGSPRFSENGLSRDLAQIMERRSKEKPILPAGGLRRLAEPPQLPRNSTERPGYIRILPKTDAEQGGKDQKKCKNCLKAHDGKFGAGRFCSLSCAKSAGAFALSKKLQSGWRPLLRANNHSQSQGTSSTDSSCMKSDKSKKRKSPSSNDDQGTTSVSATNTLAPLRGRVEKGSSSSQSTHRRSSHKNKSMAISSLLNPAP